ncbi:N-6 DNA methylase [Enterobacter kobei]|nr:N-6 DNA methylase [Enterobacter kobei]
MTHNLKAIRKSFRDRGVFYTPPELALKLSAFVDFRPKRVYDPTCGDGALLSIFPDDVEKFGQEIDASQLAVAEGRLKNFRGYAGDTLVDDGFAGEKFDLIIANPPFSVRWTPSEVDERFSCAPCVPPASKGDFAFLLHILSHLSDDGLAVVLCYPGVLYRGGREGRIRQWMVENGFIHRVASIPGNTFVDTAIPTCVIAFDKRKAAAEIEFIDGDNIIRVSMKCVAENDYNLTPSRYMRSDTAFIPLSKQERMAMELDARRATLDRLRNDLHFSRMVCDMEGFPFSTYLDDIDAITQSFRGLQ